jgi:hypothetical protein
VFSSNFQTKTFNREGHEAKEREGHEKGRRLGMRATEFLGAAFRGMTSVPQFVKK